MSFIQVNFFTFQVFDTHDARSSLNTFQLNFTGKNFLQISPMLKKMKYALQYFTCTQILKIIIAIKPKKTRVSFINGRVCIFRNGKTNMCNGWVMKTQPFWQGQ